MKHSTALLDAYGHPVQAEVNTWHPAREKGYASGAACCDDEALYTQVVDIALGALLDETTPEHIAEKVYEHLCGYVEGRTEMLAVQPLQFLTRQQTAQVAHLPRRLRLAWTSLYKRAVKRWRHAGGTLSGRKPVLPAIPGYDHGEAMKG